MYNTAHNFLTKFGWPVLSGVLLIAIFYSQAPSEFSRALDPYVNDGDVRQHIWPLWSYYDKELLADDYIKDYFLAMMPNGYQYAYGYIFSNIVSPPFYSKALSWFQFLLTIIFASLTARKLGGFSASLCTCALVFSATVFLEWSAGGLPRGFGFPIVAACCYALVTDRLLLMAALPVLGALLYPPTAVITGSVLALYCLVAPHFSVRSNWQAKAFTRRLMLLAASGLLTLAVAFPVLSALDSYGSSIDITNEEQIQQFPERLERHRLTLNRQVAYGQLGEGVYFYAKRSYSGKPPLLRQLKNQVRGAKAQWFRTVIYFLVFLGCVGLLRYNRAFRALLILPLSTFIVYMAAVAFYPLLYYPQRYITFMVPMVLVIVTPVALGAVFKTLGLSGKTYLASSALIGTLLIVLCLGGQGSLLKGTIYVARKENAQLYEFLSEQPRDSVVAGWPKGPVEAVSYLTGRQMFLSYETHLAFNEDYILQMRERMNALIDAFYSADIDALAVLHRRWGVTHLIVTERELKNRTRLRHFESFKNTISAARGAGHDTALASIAREMPQFIALRSENYLLVDLRALSGYVQLRAGEP